MSTSSDPRVSELEKFLPTRILRWGLAALLATPAIGIALGNEIAEAYPEWSAPTVLLLKLCISLGAALVLSLILLIEFSLVVKNARHGVFYHQEPAINMKIFPIICALLIAAVMTLAYVASLNRQHGYWQAWTIDVSAARQGWLNEMYRNRSDCVHKLQHAINQGSIRDPIHGDLRIKAPFGCAYQSNNFYSMLVVNTLYGASGLKCITHAYHPDPTEYDLVLTVQPASETEEWRCVWNF